MAVVALAIAAKQLRKSTARTKRREVAKTDGGEGALDHLSVREGQVDGQSIVRHLKLGEKLSIEGETLAGDPFQCIVSLATRVQADVIYVRVARAVQRVRSGESGLVQIRNGSRGIIRVGGDDQISVSLDEMSGGGLLSVVGKTGFGLAIEMENSLAEGTILRYAARCARIESRFIKTWDIPSAQSDEAILSRVSARADLAELADRMRDIQTAISFGARHLRPVPLESGVCYILGQAGGATLSFVAIADLALLIVPAFEPSMNLPEFLNGLTLHSQMHARIVIRENGPCVAVPDADGRYSLAKLEETNVVLSMGSTEGGTMDVARVELGDPSEGVITLKYVTNTQFKNVLVWGVASGS